MPCFLTVVLNHVKVRWQPFCSSGGSCLAGTGLADLSGVQTSLEDFEQTPLPTVTMVFAVVEGGKALIRKKPEVARLVHNTIGRIVHMLLMALPDRDGRQDGYLCRQQEGVLKYMLAFREPARALEWALLMQVCVGSSHDHLATLAATAD